MSFREMLVFLNKHKIHSYFMWKTHVVIRAQDFEKIKKFFKPTKTIFYKQENWRSAHRFFHFHAVKFDEFIELHCEFGNINSSYFLGVLHFFGDVIGYMLWCLFRHGRPYHRRNFDHLKKIKTHHPLHLVNVFSSRVSICCSPFSPKRLS